MIDKSKDEQIISIVKKQDNTYNSSKIKKSYILAHYPDIYNYLNTRFDDLNNEDNFKEIIYRIDKQIETAPLCPVCGKKVHFNGRNYEIFCSFDCKRTLEGKQYIVSKMKDSFIANYGSLEKYDEKRKKTYIETSLLKYGVTHPCKTSEIRSKIKNTKQNKTKDELHEIFLKEQQTCLKLYNDKNYRNTEKYKQTCIEKYNTDNAAKADIVKEKYKSTCIKKYNCTNGFAVQEIKDKIKATCLLKYNTECITQTNFFKDKSFKTKHKNGTLGKSKIEENIYYELVHKYPNLNIIYHYKDTRYPFVCDFYIKDFDLFIELQAFWTHGKHPYDCNSTDDNAIVKMWENNNSKFYNAAIETWTIRDVNKRNIAKENNLNYLEVFSCNEQEIMNVISNYLSTNFEI